MITAIIVDDEIPAVEKLERQANESGVIKIVGTFTDPEIALDFIRVNKVDAAFLDIEMPKMNGIELATKINELRKKVSIVFVTAYNQFAVEAFRINAIDYLMKPVQKHQLLDAISRIAKEKNIPINSKKLKISCFGKFTVKINDIEIIFRTKKSEELLALLVDRRGKPISRNDIIDILWEDFEGDRAVTHFNTTLYTVKKPLLAYGLENPIESNRGYYSIKTNVIECDYFDLMEAIENNSVTNAEKIKTLYKDEYLLGCDYPWCIRSRELLRQKIQKFLKNNILS